jgi:hypothetical protein
MLKKKIWANFQRIIELLTQKNVTKLSKIWVWDPGSEIRDPEKNHSGSRGKKAPDPRSRIRIRNTVILDLVFYFRSSLSSFLQKLTDRQRDTSSI